MSAAKSEWISVLEYDDEYAKIRYDIKNDNWINYGDIIEISPRSEMMYTSYNNNLYIFLSIRFWLASHTYREEAQQLREQQDREYLESIELERLENERREREERERGEKTSEESEVEEKQQKEQI